jgi:hypothetical protein
VAAFRQSSKLAGRVHAFSTALCRNGRRIDPSSLCFYYREVRRTAGLFLSRHCPSFNGRTAASGAAYRGSNPWGATNGAFPVPSRTSNCVRHSRTSVISLSPSEFGRMIPPAGFGKTASATRNRLPLVPAQRLCRQRLVPCSKQHTSGILTRSSLGGAVGSHKSHRRSISSLLNGMVLAASLARI